MTHPNHGEDPDKGHSPDRQNDLDAAIADWVVDHPEAIPILERFGIDYCCGGKSLRYACAQAGIEPSKVFAAIAEERLKRKP